MTSHIDYKRNLLHVEGMSVKVLAEKYGTPLYCYSANHIRDQFKAYHDALSKVMTPSDFTICYACKANSNLAIMAVLHKAGAGMDIVSGGELKRARKIGVTPQKIVFSGVGKDDEELTTAIRAGLLQINIESEQELHQIAKIAKRLKKKTRIALRVNPDVNVKTHKKITTGRKENKFGIHIHDAARLYKKALKMPYIDASGVAVHIGSQLIDMAPFERAYKRLAQFIKTLRAQGNTITRVDIGGGIGIRYDNEKLIDLHLYAQMVKRIIGVLGVHIILEPGRSLVGNAGILVSRVRHVKEGHNKKFLILNAAMNDLIRPTLYDAYHAVIPVKKTTDKKVTYDIVGPVCETSDTFLENVQLPNLKQGDLMSIMSTGAYGAVMASNYNTRALGAEILIDDKKVAVIRKAEKIDDLINKDIIPSWVSSIRGI